MADHSLSPIVCPNFGLSSDAYPLLMGIVNVTPDSFSDGGLYLNKKAAVQRAEQLIFDGAHIIDVGGQSTKPGSTEISEQEEIDRIVPVIESVKSLGALVSIDTSRAAVMKAAIIAGATIINDVYALQRPGTLDLVAQSGVVVCLMHMRGSPATMQNSPIYNNVTEEILEFFKGRIKSCLEGKISLNNIIIDPGFGFGKTSNHNKTIIRTLHVFKELNLPLLVGLSRKKFIRDIVGTGNINSLDDSSALVELIAYKNGADIIRAHDLKTIKRNLKIIKSL